MSLAYLGTSQFAVGVLQRLDPAPDLVVSRPDRPKGRGRVLSSPPAVLAAQEMGVAVAQPEDVNAFDLSAYDDVVVCAFGALLKEPLLSHPGLINIHPSLLPRWRGAAPLERAIMAGDADTGVCIMGVVEALDAGPVFLRAVEPIGGDDTYGTLAARLEPVAVSLLARYFAERPAGVEQADEGMVYAEKISAADRQLDPARSAEDNSRVVRALSPHIGAKAEELGVWAARISDERAEPGAISVSEGRLLWGCAGGALELVEVQPPGKRRMPAAAYARGVASRR